MNHRECRWLILAFVNITALLPAVAAGDELSSRGEAANGRAIEGQVLDSERKPVAQATILFGPADPPIPLTEDGVLRTDAQGRYRTDLAKCSWRTSTLRWLVLAPGFDRSTGKLEAGQGHSSLDFSLTKAPWKTTEIRVTDVQGRPLPGIKLKGFIEHQVPWSELETDREGRCTFKMAIDQPFVLRAAPENFRPIQVFLNQEKTDPTQVTIALLPPIQGRIRTPEGQPVVNAHIGRTISGMSLSDPTKPDDTPMMLPHFSRSHTARSDSDGRFTLAPVVTIVPSKPKKTGEVQPPQTICFADAGFTRFTYRLVDLSGSVEPLDVTLGPGRTVRIPVIWEDLDPSPNVLEHFEIAVIPSDAPEFRQPLLTKLLPRVGRAPRDSIDLALPEGKYSLSLFSEDLKSIVRLGDAERKVEVGPGEGPLALPPLRLEPTFHRKLIGKPAPEIEATDLDTGKPVHLADLRGKVVLLDFWGYWCGPCVGSMPHLVDIYHRFEGQPLVIVALHDQSVQSRTEYDQRIAFARKEFWGNQDLPFRVLLDRPDPAKAPDRFPEGTGLTCKRYAIEAFPTLFVIDKAGTMVGPIHRAERNRLESLIRELLAKP